MEFKINLTDRIVKQGRNIKLTLKEEDETETEQTNFFGDMEESEKKKRYNSIERFAKDGLFMHSKGYWKDQLKPLPAKLTVTK
jgi:hypothetical protein